MSKYTTEVRFICETEAGLIDSVGYSSINDVLSECWNKIFDFNFPIFDEDYRSVLCKKILKHFYTREICEETVGLWKLRLDARINEIMPYYNKLYSSELLSFNPLYNVDLTTTHEKTGMDTHAVTGEYSDSKQKNYTESTSSEASFTSTDKHSVENLGERFTDTAFEEKYSDTPQGSLQNVEDGTYLTNATLRNTGETQNSTDNQSGTSSAEQSSNGLDTKTTIGDDTGSSEKTENTTINSTEEYVTKVSGNNGGANYAKMLKDFRDTFLNIDVLVINELNDLFFALW